jgi:hypothetical protein
MGEGPGFAAAGTSHHQQRSVAMLDRSTLGFVQAGQETQGCCAKIVK